MSQFNGAEHRSVIYITDDESTSTPLVNALIKERFIVDLHPGNQKYLEKLSTREKDLFIIESANFALDDLSSYARLRAIYSGLLLVLTEDMDEMLQVLLYEQGIDEILLKPVTPLLVLARIRALLRRNDNKVLAANLVFDGLEINGGLRRVSYLGEEIPLTSREFDLLWYMAKRGGTQN